MTTKKEILVFNKIEEVRLLVNQLKAEKKLIGLVPTMGALHIGHLSLIEASNKLTDETIVTIFVNPTQFGPKEDFSKYPRTFESDKEKCLQLGVKAIFAPEINEMYPNGKDNIFRVVPPETYTEKLCGKSRPTHFEGVATVVTKLFNIIPAHKAFFGQKDAQQLFIIRKMVEDLNIPIEIVTCPIQREPDGLACSSRNLNLDPHSRLIAPKLYQTLKLVNTEYMAGETDFKTLYTKAKKEIIDQFTEISLEYLLAFNYNTLLPTENLSSNTLVAIAAKIGGVRLIDNIIL